MTNKKKAVSDKKQKFPKGLTLRRQSQKSNFYLENLELEHICSGFEIS